MPISNFKKKVKMQNTTLTNGIEIGAPVHFNAPTSGYGRSKVFSRMTRTKGVTPDVGAALKVEKTWQRRLRRLGARRAKQLLVK